MTPIQNEIKRVIKETLRERGVDSSDQEFIINLFDSMIDSAAKRVVHPPQKADSLI